MFEEVFAQIGLSPEEGEVYNALVEKGGLSAIEVAKATKVRRTYVYAVCEELIKKGLVKLDKRGRTTIFTPLSPDKLVDLAESRRRMAEQALSSVENVLPTLKNKFAMAEEKPVVSYFEGVEGIKKVYLDTLREAKPILALVETSQVDPVIYDWVTKVYAQRRTQAGIGVKAIVASGEKTGVYQSLDEKELRETKVISSENYPFEHELNIYGSKVAIINHRQGSKLLGVIIDNQHVANTFVSWFYLTWERLK